VPAMLSLLPQLVRLIPKVQLASLHFSPATRARILASYPPFMAMNATSEGNLFALLSGILEEATGRFIQSICSEPRAMPGSLRALQLPLVETAVGLARYLRIW